MRAVIASLLRCPVTGESLRLFVRGGESARLPTAVDLKDYDEAELEKVISESNLGEHLPDDGGKSLAERLMAYDVMAGALYTADRTQIYPIVSGIPRLLPPDVCRHPAETEYYRKLLADQASGSAPSTGEGMSEDWRKILAHNIESYTIQWDEFNYTDTTWGFTIEQRFEMILDELGIEGETKKLAGKRHVDAACGNGTLALRTAEIGLETFAFDQSHSIENADAFARQHGLPKRGIVHFIQGNLVAPPLAPGAFDMLYSGGAIHMTPDFVHTLHRLAALLKPRGSRMYVWTGRRRVIVGALYDAIRVFLKIFPIGIRRGVARVGVVPYTMIQWLLRRIYGEKAFPKLGFNENLVRFLDAASHHFGQLPTAEEFEAMVAEMDFDSQETKRPGHRGYGILAIHE